MVTIWVNMTKPLARPPREKSDADASVVSAIEAIRVVHGAPHVALKHKKLILSTMMWKVTEARWGKYDLPHRSRLARDAPPEEWRHEHVFPRKRAVEEILKVKAQEIDAVVRAHAIACVVTPAEAKRLDDKDRETPHLAGWERYRACKIHVVEVDLHGNVFDFLVPEPA